MNLKEFIRLAKTCGGWYIFDCGFIRRGERENVECPITAVYMVEDGLYWISVDRVCFAGRKLKMPIWMVDAIMYAADHAVSGEPNINELRRILERELLGG